ncbi:MAG: hypothetical protein ACPG4K_09005 [Haloferula sp.]
MRTMKQIALGLVTLCLAGPLVAEESSKATEAKVPADPWHRVHHEKKDHAELLKRQASLPQNLAAHAVTTALMVLTPEIDDLVVKVETEFDAMEEPSEVKVFVIEKGIMDDDLIGIRHIVEMARNRNREWRITGYQVGELRREHFR